MEASMKMGMSCQQVAIGCMVLLLLVVACGCGPVHKHSKVHGASIVEYKRELELWLVGRWDSGHLGKYDGVLVIDSANNGQLFGIWQFRDRRRNDFAEIVDGWYNDDSLGFTIIESPQKAGYFRGKIDWERCRVKGKYLYEGHRYSGWCRKVGCKYTLYIDH